MPPARIFLLPRTSTVLGYLLSLPVSPQPSNKDGGRQVYTFLLELAALLGAGQGLNRYFIYTVNILFLRKINH